MNASTQVAIIGAGPYGLSIAAHLRARNIDFRIFGIPMNSWRTGMPAGMFLKSEAFASNLYDPEARCTLKSFCVRNGIAYSDYGLPVSLAAFVDYGLSFQQEMVPNLEHRAVVDIKRERNGFLIQLDDGETFTAGRAIVAVGTPYFKHVPPSLAHLPPEHVSHSSDHHDLTRFKGLTVDVVGGGASALDLVAGLLDADAQVRLVARRHALKWNTPILHRPRWKQWYPMSGLGGGLRNRFYETAPMLFRLLPNKTRVRIVSTWLGPAGAWPVRSRIEQLPLYLGHNLQGAAIQDGRIQLQLVNGSQQRFELHSDHVIAATGYRVDVHRLPFLDRDLMRQVRLVENAPVLSSTFESSVRGLHFVGLTSANSFGPAMRFVLGARYTAQRLASALAARRPGD